MTFLLLAVVVIGLLGVYVLVRKNRLSSQESAKIPCDRTEDKFFYQALAESELPVYQQALDEVFGLIHADRFSGSRIPVPQQAAVADWLERQSGGDAEKRKYLRVMLEQFLHSDPALRQPEQARRSWAAQVYQRDCTGASPTISGIPSAWKVYFYNSINE